MSGDVLAGVLCLVAAASVAVTAADAAMAPARRRTRAAFVVGAVVCGVGNLVGATAVVVAGGVIAVAAIVAAVGVRIGTA